MAQSFQDLLVWHRAIDLSVSVYSATCSFPKDELYGLTSQLRRAAVSVASNIAEGRGRLTQGEFRQFLGHAQGSNFEVQTQIAIARRLGLGTEIGLEHAESISIEVGKMLSSLIASIQLTAKS
jgi:four helix bundle protein